MDKLQGFISRIFCLIIFSYFEVIDHFLKTLRLFSKQKHNLDRIILKKISNLISFSLIICFRNMIGTIFVSLAAFVVVLLYYRLSYRPRKIIKKYVADFQAKGYRVWEFPFKILGYPSMEVAMRGDQDAFSFYKEVYPNFDVAVGNFISDPEIIILNDRLIGDFAKNQKDYVYRKLPELNELASWAAGNGLSIIEGQKWKQRRKVLSKFFTYEFISHFHKRIAEITDAALEIIEKQSISQQKQKSEKKQFVYELADLTMLVSNMIMFELFIGEKSWEEKVDGQQAGKYLANLLNDLLLQIGNPLVALFGPSSMHLGLTSAHRNLKQRTRAYDQWGVKLVERRIKEQEQKIKKAGTNYKAQNIIGQLLNFNKTNSQNLCFSDYDIFVEFKNIFLAATGPSTHYLQMMIFYLDQYPEVQKKLREELQRQMKDSSDFSIETMKRLKYLDAIEKQTSRFYGPVPFLLPRRSASSHTLDGVQILKGSIVQPFMIGQHFTESYFPQPNSFNPERWLGDNRKELDSKLQDFGIGPRQCPGKHLALTQGKIGLIRFLNRYPTYKLLDPNPKMTYNIFYRPQQTPIQVRLH